MASSVQTSAATQSKQSPAGIIDRLAVLGGAMPELWIVFLVKFLAITAYQIMNGTLVLWMSSDLGFSDQKALFFVMVWSISMTVVTVLVGSLTDAIGLRKSFLLGAVICVGARLLMSLTTIKWLALAGGVLPLAVGEALGTPVMVAAIRKYSTTSQRSISFSIFYIMMNFGFLVAGLIFDYLRQHFGEHGVHALPLVGITVSTYQLLFLSSLAIEIVLLPILYFGIREGVSAEDDGSTSSAAPLCSNCGYDLRGAESEVCSECGHPRGQKVKRGTIASTLFTIRTAARDTIRNFATLGKQSQFYRLLAFLMLIAFVKLIYKQMDYAYPTFGVRELGEGAPIGRLWAVTNSALIVVLVPIVGVLAQKRSAYSMVTLGSAISAASIFVMALPLSWFQSMADGTLGHLIGHVYLQLQGPVHPWYISIFIFTVILSLGEAVYSPRVYEYAASIAPPGQEASYSALSYVPFFLAKLLVGTVSGVLLDRYCPAQGPRHSQTMWLVIAMIATIAPICLIALSRWIRVREAGREA
jgi:MFS family permease